MRMDTLWPSMHFAVHITGCKEQKHQTTTVIHFKIKMLGAKPKEIQLPSLAVIPLLKTSRSFAIWTQRAYKMQCPRVLLSCKVPKLEGDGIPLSSVGGWFVTFLSVVGLLYERPNWNALYNGNHCRILDSDCSTFSVLDTQYWNRAWFWIQLPFGQKEKKIKLSWSL